MAQAARTRNSRPGNSRRNTQQEPQAEKQPPVSQEVFGKVKAVVWANPTQNGTFHSTQFSRLYTDSQGNWKESDGFDHHDLLSLAEAARWAYYETRDLKAQAQGGQQ